jgi:hypothetical protein
MKSLLPGPAALAIMLCMGPAIANPPAAESGLAVYERGRKALARGNLAEARNCFERLLAARPDFELARIQLAQVAVAERERAKIPASLKLARAHPMERMAWHRGTVEDAVAAVGREIQRKAGGAGNVRGAVSADGVPADVRARLIDLNVRDVPIDHVLQAIGFAGDIIVAYSADGLTLRNASAGAGKWDAGDPKLPAMDAAAKQIILDRLVMEAAEPAEALDYLKRKASELSGGRLRPFFVIRHDCLPRGTVTLNLRNVSIHDALRSVCLVLDLEEKWFPWGAGIANRRSAAAVDLTNPKRETK